MFGKFEPFRLQEARNPAGSLVQKSGERRNQRTRFKEALRKSFKVFEYQGLQHDETDVRPEADFHRRFTFHNADNSSPHYFRNQPLRRREAGIEPAAGLQVDEKLRAIPMIRCAAVL